VARGTAVVTTSMVNSTPLPVHVAYATPPSSAALPEAPPQNAVLSPMVGTAFVAPQPGSPPFVTVGSKVAKGDILLIIEAMKVMNPLHAQRAGTVVQIFVSDGMPVEFGQPLLVID